MESEIDWESSDAVLAEWRRKATNAVISASLILHLPLVILVLLDYPLTTTGLFKAVVVAIYLNLAVVALMRHLAHRSRVWMLLASILVLAIITIAGFPQGPIGRSFPLIEPIMDLGLIGIEAGRIAAAISVFIQLFAPFLHFWPLVSQAFMAGASSDAASPGGLWLQSAGLTVEMLVLVVLTERFYRFLMNALDHQRQISEMLHKEYRERWHLEREIARIGDEERRHLGNEVHDGVCQQLTGALLRCQALESRLERGAPLSPADLTSLSTLLGETIEEAHGVAQGLCPLDPTPESLGPALRALVRRTPNLSEVQCEFRAVGDVEVRDPNIAQHLYRIAQEALSNAVRHSHGDRITVELTADETDLTRKVDDKGVGLPDKSMPRGLGLRTMACRVQIIEGQLTIEHAPGRGTRILCRVPHPKHIVTGEEMERVNGERDL